MAVYCVSYDLNKQGQNYNALYDELKKTDCLHILGSTWLVSSNESANQLSSRLQKVMDTNDRLFVSRVNQWQYDGWLPKTFWEWVDARV